MVQTSHFCTGDGIDFSKYQCLEITLSRQRNPQYFLKCFMYLLDISISQFFFFTNFKHMSFTKEKLWEITGRKYTKNVLCVVLCLLFICKMKMKFLSSKVNHKFQMTNIAGQNYQVFLRPLLYISKKEILYRLKFLLELPNQFYQDFRHSLLIRKIY